MKQTIAIVCVACSACFAQAAIQGQWTRGDFRASVCNVEQMTVEIRVQEAFGEPIIGGRMRWEAGPNTNHDCLASDTAVYVRVGEAFGVNGYVRLNPEVRTAGTGFGSRVNQSPNWNELFCDAPREKSQCLSADEAKALFVENPRLLSFEIVTRSSAVSNRIAASSRRIAAKLDLSCA